MKPFDDRNKRLVEAWNALIDSMRKWGKHDTDCRDEFDNPILIPVEKETDDGLEKGGVVL